MIRPHVPADSLRSPMLSPRSHRPRRDWLPKAAASAHTAVSRWQATSLFESAAPRQFSGLCNTVSNWQHWESISPLLEGLAAISDDGYQRRRNSIRTWPRKRQQDKTGAPQIRSATSQESNIAKQLKPQAA